MKILTAVKSCLFLALATLSFGAVAGHCKMGNCDPVYVGNPDRPDTIWVPGHYTQAGAWKDGYYIKFYRPVCSGELVWKGDHYDYARPYRAVRSEDLMYVDNTCGVCKHKYNFVNSARYNCHIGCMKYMK